MVGIGRQRPAAADWRSVIGVGWWCGGGGGSAALPPALPLVLPPPALPLGRHGTVRLASLLASPCQREETVEFEFVPSCLGDVRQIFHNSPLTVITVRRARRRSYFVIKASQGEAETSG